MSQFDREHMISYCPFIVTVAFFVSLSTYSEIMVEHSDIYIPHLYSTPCRGWPYQNFAEMFYTGKLEWWCCHMLMKVWWYVKPFRYNTGAGQTDRQTDGRTDRIPISISRVSTDERYKHRPNSHKTVV